MHRRQINIDDPMYINIKNQIPGPGYYEQKLNLNRVGVYKISNMRNSLAATWGPAGKRFLEENRNTKHFPGPGQY